MKKYINYLLGCKNNSGGGKARTDIRTMLQDLGYVPVNIGGSSSNKLLRNLLHCYRLFLLPLKLKKGDELFWQYPYVYNYPKLFYRMLLVSKASYSVMIHDMDNLRGGNDGGKEAYKLLQHASRIVIATTAMKNALSERIGNEGNMVVSEIFDYLSDKVCQHNSLCGNSIVFAGNLLKSQFVAQLNNVIGDLHFYLYGKGKAIPKTDKVECMGVFEANDISGIKGDWGLVWDGDSIDTCSGDLGEYLKICASHKNSLYLACGKPLIVWSQSAMADFVKRNGLGICVDSLNDVYDSIQSLTREEKHNILHNVAEVSVKLRQGYYFRNAIGNETI